MKRFEYQVHITAGPQEVWAGLADLSAWPQFDPFTISVEGRLEQGSKVSIRNKLAPNREFTVTVTTCAPPHRLVFADGMPFGLFKGVRTYTVTPAHGGSDFAMQEVFSGPMLPMIAKHLPDMTDAFVSFCNGLKSYVEADRL